MKVLKKGAKLRFVTNEFRHTLASVIGSTADAKVTKDLGTAYPIGICHFASH